MPRSRASNWKASTTPPGALPAFRSPSSTATPFPTRAKRRTLRTIPSSQVTGQLGFRFLEDKLIVGGEVQYNGAPKGNPIADDYTLVNVFASYQATEDFKFDFRADNLFDVDYTNPLNASTTTPIYEPGVTLKLAATMRFGG